MFKLIPTLPNYNFGQICMWIVANILHLNMLGGYIPSVCPFGVNSPIVVEKPLSTVALSII